MATQGVAAQHGCPDCNWRNRDWTLDVGKPIGVLPASPGAHRCNIEKYDRACSRAIGGPRMLGLMARKHRERELSLRGYEELAV